jgi:cytochrome c oxidase assembly factor CtaG
VSALFGHWEFRPVVVLVLIPLVIIYLTGWFRIRSIRGGQTHLATGWRLAAYLTGMGVLAAALMSPIDYLGGDLFFMHMIQHKLTIMVAAPLIWLGNPFPIGVWGLPRTARLAAVDVFSQSSPVRTMVASVTQPILAFFIFLFVYLGWHDPGAYNSALTHSWVHDLQHITFFLAAMLFWWHVIGAAPRIHATLSPWVAVAMLIGIIPFNAITGFAIANADSVIYTYYESIPRIWGYSALEDQAIGGVIMWIPGSEMFFQAAIAVIAVMFMRERKKNRTPVPSAAETIADADLIAPGLESRVTQAYWRDLAKQRANLHREPTP